MSDKNEVSLFYVECDQCDVYLWTENGWVKTHRQPVAGDHVICLSSGDYKEHTVLPDLSRTLTKKADRVWNGVTPEMLTATIVSAADLRHAQRVA